MRLCGIVSQPGPGSPHAIAMQSSSSSQGRTHLPPVVNTDRSCKRPKTKDSNNGHQGVRISIVNGKPRKMQMDDGRQLLGRWQEKAMARCFAGIGHARYLPSGRLDGEWGRERWSLSSWLQNLDALEMQLRMPPDIAGRSKQQLGDVLRSPRAPDGVWCGRGRPKTVGRMIDCGRNVKS